MRGTESTEERGPVEVSRADLGRVKLGRLSVTFIRALARPAQVTLECRFAASWEHEAPLTSTHASLLSGRCGQRGLVQEYCKLSNPDIILLLHAVLPCPQH